MRTRIRPIAPLLVLLLALQSAFPQGLQAGSFKEALDGLKAVGGGTAGQLQIKDDWETVVAGGIDRLVVVLEAMVGVGPLAENWLRAAVDTIAERELQATGKLPVEVLEKFVLDLQKAPRARRTAFEWLVKFDPTANDRLLPSMLDDRSLEIRHDAVARLLAQAEGVSDEDEKRSQIRRALQSARSLDQMKQSVELLQELGETPDLAVCFGYLTSWHVIGPFDNVGRAGFSAVYPPEEEIDLAKKYPGKNGVVDWVEWKTEGEDLGKVGVVDLNEVLEEEKEVAAYVVATFVSPREQVLQCRYGTVNATKLWINGELLIDKNIYHMGGEFDQYIAEAKFHRGENTILLKICQNEQTESWAREWNFRLRVTDLLGGGVAQGDELSSTDRNEK